MDIEEYLKKETGLPVAEVVFTSSPKLPYIAFIDQTQGDGDDFHTRLLSHDLAVELYAARIDKENEKKIEAAFEKQEWKVAKKREWIAEEKMFETIYTTNFTEKR